MRLEPTLAPDLASLQKAMAGAVMRPLGPGDAMRRENGATATALIKPNDRLTAFERLQLYNQQYWWRLLGAFGEDFRGLRAVLGERRFDRLANAYLDSCGSTSWNLRDLGQHLERFIHDHPDSVRPYGELALDMARVEWARVIAFDGPDAPRLDPQRLAGRPPGEIQLALQPYLTLLELRHPIDTLLRRLKRADTNFASNAVSGARRARRIRLSAEAAAEPIYLAVHRVDLTVYFKRLDPAAFRLLTGLRAGNSLEDSCADAFTDSLEPPDQISNRVQTWFASWMHFGWLCGA